MATATKPQPIQTQYPNLRAGSGVDWRDVNGQVLKDLELLAERFKQTFTITSGYRTPAQSMALGESGTDPHTRGIAADVTAGGRPLGAVLTNQQIASVGLSSGNVAGFDKTKAGGYDPVHVQLGSINQTTGVFHGTSEQQSNAALIIKSAEQAGLSPFQADQLVGAAYAESGLRTGAINKSSGAMGLFQLLSSGYVNAYNALVKKGESPAQANIDAILPAYTDYFKKHPNAAPGEAAAAVEASGKPASWYTTATTTANELLGIQVNPNTGTLTPFQSTGGVFGGFGARAGAGAQGVETAGNALTGWVGDLTGWIEKWALRIGTMIAGAALIALGVVAIIRSSAVPRVA